MAEEFLKHSWAAQLAAHKAQREREAMMNHISDIATPGTPIIIDSSSEPWYYAFIGWLMVGAVAFCIVAIGAALQ